LEREQQFWSKEIVVKIEYKYCPNLTIIDTPGKLTSNSASSLALSQQGLPIVALRGVVPYQEDHGILWYATAKPYSRTDCPESSDREAAACPSAFPQLYCASAGLISAAPGRRNSALQQSAKQVENMVRNKMEQREYIILCLEDSNDWSNATSRRLVMQVCAVPVQNAYLHCFI